MSSATHARRTKQRLIWTFGGIIALLLLAHTIEYLEWHGVQENVNGIEGDALESVRLVERMGLDVLHQRILVDRHVFEHDDATTTNVDAQIAIAKDDYDAAARSYAPLATSPPEANAWHRFTADVTTANVQLDAVLKMFRASRDTEANQLIAAADRDFAAVDRDMALLVAINQIRAKGAAATGVTLQYRTLSLRLALTAAILVITLVSGIKVTRGIARTEQELEDQTTELANRNRELDAFSGRVAHDLGGPLHTMGLATAMLGGVLPKEKAAAGILGRCVAQMTNLVQDLLELSRLGAPTVGAIARTEAVATSIENDLGPKVREAGGDLSVTVEPACVRCSEGLLRQALWNLGENALKYRRPEVPPRLELTGRINGAGYEFVVADNGVGMPPDDARQAFEPFFRSEHTKLLPGTGLGLAIVRRIIEASGGTISVESTVGQGSTFVINLPLEPRANLPTASPRESRQNQ